MPLALSTEMQVRRGALGLAKKVTSSQPMARAVGSDGIRKENLNGGSSARLPGRVDFLEARRRRPLDDHHFRNCLLATRTPALLVAELAAQSSIPYCEREAAYRISAIDLTLVQSNSDLQTVNSLTDYFILLTH